ncbi:MAG: RuBisCO large subunit C-terminal-like domain-containing protein, partial [Acetobacteraceae bacterium]
PQGLAPQALAAFAERLGRGGLDFVKDDHGLADQAFAPFAERVPLCADAMRRAAAATGHVTRYVPSLSGDFEAMRSQMALVGESGLDTVLISPLIAGFSTVQALVRQFPEIAILAHPSLGGVHIAPALLIGRLFPLIGADAVIFPNHGGRFGYTPEACLALAQTARAPGHRLRPALPVPAGGMTLSRVPEILDFYGPDVMLLIGGSLLSARERLTEETASFTRTVATHFYRPTS